MYIRRETPLPATHPPRTVYHVQVAYFQFPDSQSSDFPISPSNQPPRSPKLRPGHHPPDPNTSNTPRPGRRDHARQLLAPSSPPPTFPPPPETGACPSSLRGREVGSRQKLALPIPVDANAHARRPLPPQLLLVALGTIAPAALVAQSFPAHGRRHAAEPRAAVQRRHGRGQRQAGCRVRAAAGMGRRRGEEVEPVAVLRRAVHCACLCQRKNGGMSNQNGARLSQPELCGQHFDGENFVTSPPRAFCGPMRINQAWAATSRSAA